MLNMTNHEFRLLRAARNDYLGMTRWTLRRTPDELRALLPVLGRIVNDEGALMHERVTARFMAEDARCALTADVGTAP